MSLAKFIAKAGRLSEKGKVAATSKANKIASDLPDEWFDTPLGQASKRMGVNNPREIDLWEVLKSKLEQNPKIGGIARVGIGAGIPAGLGVIGINALREDESEIEKIIRNLGL